MNGTGMVWVLGHGALEVGHDLVRSSFRLPAAVGPVVPWLGVHHRFGMEHGDLSVVRKAFGDVSERIRPSFVERGTIGLGISRIPLGQSGDKRLFLGAGLAASACARSSAASAGALAEASMGTLMFGPST